MKTHTWVPSRRSACVTFAAALILSRPASAQITVTTAADENDTPVGAQVSLREALRDSPSGGQITFDAVLHGKVLVLTADEMTVTGKTLTVNAPGGFVIEARGLSRIFNVAAGAGLNLTGLTLQGGRAPADGGAILNAGTLSLTDCVLRENGVADGTTGAAAPPRSAPSSGITGGTGGAGSGGGAVSSTGNLTALRCYFTSNAAGNGGTGGRGGDVIQSGGGGYPGGKGGTGGTGGTGGAILSAGPLQLTECIFESNRAGTGGTGGASGDPPDAGGTRGRSGNGGAVSQTGGMTVEGCTFMRNECPSAVSSGGGNGEPGSGTAVFWNSGTAVLTNCTFTSNGLSETATSAGGEHGGAISSESGTLLRLVHCTLAGNLVGPASTAAGIVSTSLAPVECYNCIISGNMRNRGSTSTPIWEEANFSPNTPRMVIPFSLLGTPGIDARLGPLAETSGTLPVLVPQSDSLAVDAGTMINSPPATDQRGLPRAVGAPDLGAVEVQQAETVPRVYQHITLGSLAILQESSFVLTATSSGGLPVSYELISGPATLNGTILSLTGSGLVAVRAFQPGNEVTAPALPVVSVIDTARLQFIPFTPVPEYFVDIPNARVLSLPDRTSAGLPIIWSLPGPPQSGVGLNNWTLTVSRVGSVQLEGSASGNEAFDPVTVTWTLNFVDGALWWETPLAPGGGLPWFTLVEGSPHGLSLTARINGPRSGPVPVPAMPGLTVVPSFIPAGATSVQCMITVPPGPITNTTRVVQTGHPSPTGITLFLANRLMVPLNVFAPARVIAGTSARVDVSCPGVTAFPLLGPPPDLGQRSVTVTAFDFDDPAISVPVALDSAMTGPGPYPTIYLRVTFPPVNRRVRLKVTTDDGITGQSGPVQILADTNADGDGINDVVEAALQRTPDQFHPPPLTFERDGTGLHAVLAARPRNLQGWSVVIELSTGLQTWTPAPGGSTSVTPNPDGTTERVSVLLPTDAARHFVRLTATLPP